ncbi:pyrroloquinoline quinone biosynthesis protein PqqE [Cereibacter sphaeroides WS8N]|uniref:pyrroloquinoline quinone biosynthesis protein PqqE n=1 Tax=Cereibacter sphaeroides TaxID=1063 RepID=UPI00020DF554|nr:pyrroloquinoline quinone biosynthesis protein PqqE [Cereibacter sphaeroides]EGJ22282.1 pyrroloquinoline quinone biosynthesis protein PqqE [Cereibacter sphaeroides WS8N]
MDDHAFAAPAPAAPTAPALPMAVLAELTHRCPLQCPYCSNPVELEAASRELSTEDWQRVIGELAALGVLQIHFSGGEPLVRRDLVALVAHADRAGLYTNLITSAVMFTRAKVAELAEAGLAHVQVSLQGASAPLAERIGGFRGGHAKKIEAAAWVRAEGMALTLNAVMHRQNLDELPRIVDMAVEMGAQRLEVAHVQYYGWALKNRAALMPTLAQLDEATRIVEEAQARLAGVLAIDYVIPDYYAVRPKTCMGGWGRQFFNISPSGKVLPCHAAETITGLRFDSVCEAPLAEIWQRSEALNLYRGTGWMQEPCRSCIHAEEDFGGCRCQAFALAGDAAATDPACAKSPLHAQLFSLAGAEAEAGSDRFLYRNFSGGTPEG